jgi:hypothetical protein
LALAGALVAVAQSPTGASASVSVPSVSLSATPASLTYPAIVTLTARASDVDTTVAKYQVRSADSTIWADLGSIESTTGQFALTNFPKKNSYYRVSVGSVESTPALYVPVHVLLSTPAATKTRLRLGEVTTLSGTIRPYHAPGAPPADVKYRLVWQKWSPSLRKWVPAWSTAMAISGVVDNDTTKWTRPHRARTLGTYRVRFFHECPRHAATYSPWRTIEVVR